MSYAHEGSRLALEDVLVPTDNETILFHYDRHLNSTQGLKPVFSKIRYIRDSLRNNTSNLNSNWMEIQAYDQNGVNVAFSESGDNVTGNFTPAATGYGFNIVTNGKLDDGTVWQEYSNSEQYVQVDLFDLYEISYIKIWHWYADGRVFHGNKTEVSHDGVHWITVFDSDNDGEYAETSEGHLIDLRLSNKYTYEYGRYDGCIGIFEATSNMIAVSRANFTGWTAYGGASVTLTQGQCIPGITLNGATRIQTSGGSGADAYLKYYTSVGSGVLGMSISGSVWVYNCGSTAVRVNGNAVPGYAIIQPGEIKYCTIGTSSMNSTGSMQLRFGAYTSTTDSLDFIAYQPQMEKKAYPTAYTKVSRANHGFLQYELPYSPMNVSFWAKLNDGVLRGDSRYIMSLHDDSSYGYWDLYINGSTKDLYLEVVYPIAAGSSTVEHRYCMCYNSDIDIFDQNWHFINFWFDTNYAYLMVDENVIQSSTMVDTTPSPSSVPITFDTTTLNIGCSYNSIYLPGNLYIDELRIDNQIYNTLNNTDEADAWRISNKPFYDPYDYSVELF